MRKMLFGVAILASMLSCSGPTEPAPVISVTVTAPNTTLASGSTAQLTASPNGKNGTPLEGRTIAWSSSNTSIATISQTGLVSAGNIVGATAEQATITATVEGVTGSVALTITPVAINRVTISVDSFSIITSDSTAVSYLVEGANGLTLTGRTATITLGDTLIGQIRNGYLVTRRYLTPETKRTTLIVTAEGKADTAAVIVRPFAVARIGVVPFDSAFFPQERKRIRAAALSVKNDTLQNRAITYTSSAQSIARIVGDTVIAIDTGRAVITIAADTAKSLVVARIDTATTYTIPVNLGAISYPQSYLTSTTSHADIVTDSCAIAPPTGKITIPKSFMGTRPLPELLATDRLVSQASRGMRVKDVWDVNNAAYVRGCASSIRNAFTVTIERLKAMGVDYLTLAPWTFGQVSNSGQYRIGNPSEMNSSTISDTDLRWAVTEAKQRGVKVHWLNQIQALCRGGFAPCGVESTGNIDAAGVAGFMGAYRVFMLNRAALLDSIGVDVMQVGCICYFPTWSDDAIGRVYLDSMQVLIPEIKRVFRGKLRMGWNSALGRYPTLLDNIDYIEHGSWSNKPPEEFNAASVEDLAAEFYDRWECNFRRCNLDFTAKLATIPAIWNLGQASHGKTTRGTYEETFCTTTVDAGPEDLAGCIQRSVKTDFSIQANVIQAQLRAFQNQSVIPVFAFELGDYWPVDKLDPTTSFPNIAYSPRNKPAEAVLKHWFRK